MYRAFVIVHRWLALVTAAFLIVVAISGALLVLEGPIARASQEHVQPGSAPLSLDTLVQRARANAGGGRPTVVLLGDSPDLAWGVVLASTSRAGGGTITNVLLNQYTGTILPEPAAPDRLSRFIRTVHLLHTRLLGGQIGNTIVAAVTFVALFLVVSGIIIWWREKLWRINTSASWKRINFDLHHSLGVFSAIVLLFITSTGLWVHYGVVDDWMRKLNRSPSPSPPTQPGVDSGTPELSLDSIAAVARTAIPGAAIMNIQLHAGRVDTRHSGRQWSRDVVECKTETGLEGTNRRFGRGHGRLLVVDHLRDERYVRAADRERRCIHIVVNLDAYALGTFSGELGNESRV